MRKKILILSALLTIILSFVLAVNVSADTHNNDDCITFSSDTEFSLESECGKAWDGKLYYSVNKTDWTEWSGSKLTAAKSGDTYYIYLYGDENNTIISQDESRWIITSDASEYYVDCTGNIETLRGATGNNPSNTAMGKSCYAYLFKNNTALRTAPALPATELADGCYSFMFNLCPSLQTPPALPATELKSECYMYMFAGCHALQTAPALPATKLANECYMYMFAECTSLQTAPALPATKLTSECYNGMFIDCTSLQTAPALPATELEDFCYIWMFINCTSLTAPADMPVITSVGEYSCDEMYSCCTKLKINTSPSAGYEKPWMIPASVTTFAANAENMFKNTAGTFTGVPVPGTTYYVKGVPPHTHTWTYSLKEGTTDTVVAVCTEGCNYTGTDLELTISASDKTYDKTAVTAGFGTATTFHGGALPTSITYQKKNGETWDTATSTAPVNAGIYRALLTLSNGETPVTVYTSEFTISPKPLTATGLSVMSKTYDGTTNATISEGALLGVISGDDVDFSAHGSFSDKETGEEKSVEVSFVLTGEDAENYEISDTTITADITKRNVTISSNSASKKYDGTPLTYSSTKITSGSFAGEEGFTTNFTGTQTLVGSTENIFEYVLNNGTNANNYNITVNFGTLTVTPNDTLIIITPNSNSKIFDGTELTDSNYSCSGSLAEGDYFASVTVTGTITAVGTTANEVTGYTIKNQSGLEITSFYNNIQTASGTLTIEPDTVFPVIKGIVNGSTCYTTQKFTVIEDHLDYVMVNGKIVTDYTLIGNINNTYIVTATDKSGNKTTITVTMKSIESLTDSIKDITTNNVKPSDSKTILDVKNTVAAIVTANATQSEKNALKQIIDNCNSLSAELHRISYEPEIIDGANQTVDISTDTTASFRSEAPFSEFVKVVVDGNDVDTKYYEVIEDSTTVTLKKSFLTTLSTGTHTISIVSANGHADSFFIVTGQVSPETSDIENPVLWIALLVISSLCIFAISFRSKRKAI